MLINKSMKIDEIVMEFVEPGRAQANKTALDNEVVKQKELEVAAQDGNDLETEEATSDFPA